MIHYLLIAAFSATSAFGGAWYVQALRCKEIVATIEAEHREEIKATKDLVESQFKEMSKNHAKALQNAVSKQATLSRDVVASRDALVRLSSAAEDAIRSSRDSLDSCNATAYTFKVVFNDCAGKYEQLGRETQGHVIDKQTLIDSLTTTGN